ncbi:MAG: TIGR03620 family F420-dependent LLM class oxidoreductase [Gammaproteobacteria bacterium]
MKFGKYGVFTFTDLLDARGLGELCGRLEELGYSTLWYPEAMGYETFAAGAYLLSQSKKLVVASGIANIYARDPSASVMGHDALNRLYDNRFVLGLGVSHAPLVNDVRGHQYSRPVATMRAYLEAMNQAWTALGSMGMGVGTAPRQVVLAALGPKMSELAADMTLGVFPYNITPDQVALSRAAMGKQGAIICEQKVCLCEDPVQARAAARAALSFYIGLPNYYNNWFRLGFDQGDLENGGSDRLMDAMVLWGNAATIKARLARYFEQGADQVVIQPLRADGQPGPDYAALEALAG